MIKRLVNITLLMLITLNYSYSQDIRGGMLNVSHVNSFQYKGTLKLLIDPSVSVSRPYVLVDWGVSTDTLFYVFDTPLNAQETQGEYVGFFTYPSNGTYQISYQDTYRVVGINNIVNSQLETLALNNTLVINPFLGNNSLPQLFYNPNNIIESNGTYIIDPNIVDADGDSLYFKLINSTGSGYYTPQVTSIDSLTGIVTTTPDTIGVYDYVIEVEEYRNAVFIGSAVFEFVVNINTVVGIEDILNNDKINIYPNPNNGIFTIEKNIDENTTLEVYNLSGQLILQKSFVGNTTQVNLTNYPKGIYLVKIIADNKVTVEKIVYQ